MGIALALGLERSLIHRFFDELAETSGIEIEAESATRRAMTRSKVLD